MSQVPIGSRFHALADTATHTLTTQVLSSTMSFHNPKSQRDPAADIWNQS
jgi:hypothetical protein